MATSSPAVAVLSFGPPTSPISGRYADPAVHLVLGEPTSDEKMCPDKVGSFRNFQNGSIYSYPRVGPLQRFFCVTSGDHFYSTQIGLAANPPAGYSYEGVCCHVHDGPSTGTVPLHRFFDHNVGKHFYTTVGATPPAGFEYEGVSCYVHAGNDAGTVPVYRHYNPAGGDHFYTTDPQAPAGYVYERIEFYGETQPSDFVTHHVLHGIGAKWVSLGAESGFLGYPETDELTCPDGHGRFNHFQGGSIYWTPESGAHEVHGGIRTKWESLGWERGFLGYPMTDETATPDGDGRFNHFQGGSIYWTSGTGAFEVHGSIRAKWEALGWERGFLGYPLTDETRTPNGLGSYNHFQGGSIYATPATGAHEVHGAIRNAWSLMGWERSYLGFPLTDELATPGTMRCQRFQGGALVWSSQYNGIREFPGTDTMYLLGIDKFHIDCTRAKNMDTDHLIVGVKVGDQNLVSFPVKHMGDVRDGDHMVNLYLDAFKIPKSTDVVLFNYVITNSGSDDYTGIENGLQKAAEAGLAYLGVPGAGTIVAIADQVYRFFNGSCDGPVAMDQIYASGELINGWTPGEARVHSETRFYQYQSQCFCGADSKYWVTWSAIRL